MKCQECKLKIEEKEEAHINGKVVCQDCWEILNYRKKHNPKTSSEYWNNLKKNTRGEERK